MQTIVYGKRNGSYLCLKIEPNSSDKTKIIFEEPLTGKLVMGKSLFPVKSGTLEGDLSLLPSGEYSPVLFMGSSGVKLEEIIIKDGEVSRKSVNDEFIRALSDTCNDMLLRLERHDEILERITKMLNESINL